MNRSASLSQSVTANSLHRTSERPDKTHGSLGGRTVRKSTPARSFILSSTRGENTGKSLLDRKVGMTFTRDPSLIKGATGKELVVNEIIADNIVRANDNREYRLFESEDALMGELLGLKGGGKRKKSNDLPSGDSKHLKMSNSGSASGSASAASNTAPHVISRGDFTTHFSEYHDKDKLMNFSHSSVVDMSECKLSNTILLTDAVTECVVAMAHQADKSTVGMVHLTPGVDKGSIMSEFLDLVSSSELSNPVFTLIGGQSDKQLYDWANNKISSQGHNISPQSVFNPTNSGEDSDNYAAVAIGSGGHIFYTPN